MSGSPASQGSPAIQVRDANPEDRDFIQSVMLAAYSEYRTLLPTERWEQYQASIRASAHGEGPAARLVAELDGEIVGSVQLYLSSEAAYGLPQLEIHDPIIRYLSVSPHARGLGIATELIKESARRAHALGASNLYLHTSDMMASAVRLYERLGFERACEKDMHNGPTHVKSYQLHLKQTALI